MRRYFQLNNILNAVCKGMSVLDDISIRTCKLYVLKFFIGVGILGRILGITLRRLVVILFR